MIVVRIFFILVICFFLTCCDLTNSSSHSSELFYGKDEEVMLHLEGVIITGKYLSESNQFEVILENFLEQGFHSFKVEIKFDDDSILSINKFVEVDLYPYTLIEVNDESFERWQLSIKLYK
jgi:hypothetical protein